MPCEPGHARVILPGNQIPNTMPQVLTPEEQAQIDRLVFTVTNLIDLAESATNATQMRADQNYQDLRRRIIASVRQCATMPTEAIESMPGRVRELAFCHAELYETLGIVKAASATDETWAALRAGIQNAAAAGKAATH